MKKVWIFALLSCIGVAAAVQPGRAQQPQGNLQTPPLEQAGPQVGTAPLPDVYRLNIMIRSSIIALNHANRTGNYTVLLDLASPSFRAANDSGRLAQIFSRLRQRNLDLSPILFYTPQLIRQPQVAPNGLLRLVGYFPTAPERVNFDLYFQLVGEEWKIFGIGVEMSSADVTASLSSNSQGGNAQLANTGSERAQIASSGDANGNLQARANKPGNRKSAQAAAIAPLPERGIGNRPQAKATSSEDETQMAVENRTTNNATRIDLSQPDMIASEKNDDNVPKKAPAESKSLWESFNPFAND